ncbi:MAG TPA: tetratricopeptide repeat protein, partial [Polyangiaceae bacterium]
MTLDPAPGSAQADSEDAAGYAELGRALLDRGDHPAAAQALVRAISLNPRLAVPSFHLGLAARALGDVSAAVAGFERATDLEPSTFHFEHELARALASNDEDERAVGHYQAALIANPSSSEVLMELGVVLGRLGRYPAAVAVARRAVGLRPDSPQAHAALGVSLRGVTALDESVEHLEKARALRPGWAAVERELALTLREMGELERAVEHASRALELDPLDYRAHGALVELAELDPSGDRAALEAEARRWHERHGGGVESPPYAVTPEPGRRLRVGYVFESLGTVENGASLVPLFLHHDRRVVEIFAYSCVERPDGVTAELRQRADRFRDVRRLDDEALSERIRADRIDVIVDLVGYGATTRFRAIARRPAPLSVAWSFVTSVLPPRLFDGEVTEVAYGPSSEAPVTPLPALSRGALTFGALGPIREVNARVVETFARVLGACAGARLLVAAPRGEARTRRLEAFARAGIATERVEFLDPAPRPLRSNWYERVDVVLDTFPCSGSTRTFDAVWHGVPVVTLGAGLPNDRGARIARGLGLD